MGPTFTKSIVWPAGIPTMGRVNCLGPTFGEDFQVASARREFFGEKNQAPSKKTLIRNSSDFLGLGFLGCFLRSPAKGLTFSGLIGKPISWQTVKVLTSKENAPKGWCTRSEFDCSSCTLVLWLELCEARCLECGARAKFNWGLIKRSFT